MINADLLISPTDMPALFWLAALVLVAQAATWQWLTSQRQTRRGVFFGVRVQPGFIESDQGRVILRNFRLRIWIWTAILTCLYTGMVLRGLSDLQASYFLLATMIVSLVGFQLSFWLANRVTRFSAGTIDAPPVRTASLFVGREVSRLAVILSWLSILAPVSLPVAAAILLGLNWSPTDYSKPDLLSIIFATLVALFPAMVQFALYFRARSKDWAPTAAASWRYRFVLGAAQSVIFTLIVLDVCGLALVRRSILFSNMESYFHFTDIAYIFLGGLILAAFVWLKNNFMRGNVDPMPDHYWKWGWFYCNPDDSALVVPQRSGLGYSLNYAKTPVWLIAATIVIAAALGLIHFAGIA
jgi:uncharacterized membrane protein